MRWSEDDLSSFNRRREARRAAGSQPAAPARQDDPAPSRPHHGQRFTRGKVAFAKGRLKPDVQNAQEKRYDAYLANRLQAGEIQWYKFQGIKLRLADNTFYTPDFNVMAADSVLEMHEVKGFWQDTGRVKIKVVSDLYPMRFVAIKERAKKHGGGYEFEDFSRVEPASPLPLLDGSPATNGPQSKRNRRA